MTPNLTALYLRLSRDDGKLHESESIVNQKAFLTSYAEAHSLNVVEIFSDDGFSGLSFDRPGFKRMLAMIESKKVNTVVTKDLSRLGRDYIEVGNYTDKYFPMHNVRYIAVNDGIDTGTPAAANDMTPFRAVFNDMYARDISQKVRTALLSKKSSGKFIGSQAPYGYQKDPNDKNHLLIDEKTAVYVRRIYREFLSGASISAIARGLCADKIPSPSEQKSIMSSPTPPECNWNNATVRRILTTPTYAGHLTQNTTKKLSYKLDTRLRIPENEWIISPNTHEAIIPQSDFDAAKTLISVRGYSRAALPQTPHPLSGLVFCKECGGRMSFVRESKTRCYLVCGTYRKNPAQALCTSHCFREAFAEDIIRNQLKALAQSVGTPMNFDPLEHRILSMLIDKVLIGDDKSIEIHFKFSAPH